MIKIGIIDSGIEPNYMSQLNNVSALKLSKDNLGQILIDHVDISDKNGHGNVCFQLISSVVPEANYLIIKVFEERLVTELDILETAIRICINDKVDIINISAGLTSETIPHSLKMICDEAFRKGILIVAAKNNEGSRSYPANYEKVLSVELENDNITASYGVKNSKKNDLFISGNYLSKECKTICTSFACAKMTGIISKLLINKGRLSLGNLNKELIINGSNN
ncbi:S8 family serine peptidase [Sphingobacterium sp. UBA6320]|jgi:subtilisin family serine protease|uniref:S8 family serine peptidase n=1 Tax=Sphingobacterium sp. UBA6320 TaxID=1947510 RepID=UPI0025D929AE|nr:S8 family serine peptidase [Sphingobacterium sp. UBA6320]